MKSLRSDRRYTWSLEFCGYAKPKWILRFCDEWVACFDTEGAAMMRAMGESAKRRGCAIIEAK